MGTGMSNEESKQFTKECLRKAAFEMLKEKKLGDISITELCRKAGVSRMAFYRNYPAREDFEADLAGSHYELVFQVFSSPMRRQDPARFYKITFDWIREHFESIRGFYTVDAFFFINARCNEITDPEERCRMLCYYSSMMAITTNWIQNGMQESSEEMAGLCAKILCGI